MGIFLAGRLLAYGYALAAFYAAILLGLYNQGVWLLDKVGAPIYTEFTCQWIAGLLALHGQARAVYDPFEFLKMQMALVGPKALYGIWPYPPTYFLILMPFASLSYVTAFLTWSLVSLFACVAVVYFIVRRPAAIALVLASPFTAWNFVAGHNGFLTAAFFGATLLLLERRPVLAGFFIGCLTYKPHFGILFPVALASFRQWRAFSSAAVTAVLLAGASIGVLGSDTWEALPRQFIWFAGETLATGTSADRAQHWGKLQTIYGLVRYLNGGGTLAWMAQGATTCAAALIVWLVWKSRATYQLKAATLSTLALIATPYGFATDMAAIAISSAFLASDQIRRGVLKGEQPIMIALFGMGLLILPTFGRVPLGPLVVIVLSGVILRRALYYGAQRTIFSPGECYTDRLPPVASPSQTG
jgi:arabinofuranan 3-O-arabinosyltransferase